MRIDPSKFTHDPTEDEDKIQSISKRTYWMMRHLDTIQGRLGWVVFFLAISFVVSVGSCALTIAERN